MTIDDENMDLALVTFVFDGFWLETSSEERKLTRSIIKRAVGNREEFEKKKIF